MNKPHILMVEDDAAVGNLIATTLETQNYQFHRAKTGASALVDALSYRPDVMLLDLGLPDMDGLDVLKELSGLPQEVPVIIISARDRESEKVKALDMGADDYVTKPFSTQELVARVRSQLRRYTSLGDIHSSGENTIVNGRLCFNLDEHVLYADGEPIKLTATETKIVELLMRNPGRIFPAEEIYSKIWNESAYSTENTVMVHIRRIREKIEINPGEPEYLKVVWGIGYKFEKH